MAHRSNERVVTASLASRGCSGHGPRLLVLDIRCQKAGFVVLEPDFKLLDWGVRTYATRGADINALVARRVDALLDLHTPCVVVVRQTVGPGPRIRTAIQRATQTVRLAAKKRSIGFKVLEARSVREFFIGHGCHNKHQIAVLLGRRFVELSWKLAPKRKPWQPEDHSQTVFDAAATAVAFLSN